MNTKVSNPSETLTDRILRSFSESVAAVGHCGSSGGGSNWTSSSQATETSAWQSAIYRTCPRAAEASRQIERAKSLSAREYGTASLNELQLRSVASCVALISDFSRGPFSIPIASSGEDGEATLFIDDNLLYADIEISGNEVEYYFRSKCKNGVEVFDTEEMEDGYIPPRMLASLYAYAFPKK